MDRTITTRVKGTQYYSADRAFREQLLYPGAQIALIREPHNPHDSNAISIWLEDPRLKLGHVSRDLAPRYAELLDSCLIVGAQVSSASTDRGGHVRLMIQISYIDEDADYSPYETSVFSESIRLLEAVSGVYRITNTKDGSVYIGSSTNIRKRGYSHIQKLRSGSHANKRLQEDYNTYGPDYFRIECLVSGVSPAHLAEMEERKIAEERLSGSWLYNLTDDGQGRVPINFRYTAPEGPQAPDITPSWLDSIKGNLPFGGDSDRNRAPWERNDRSDSFGKTIVKIMVGWSLSIIALGFLSNLFGK